MKKAKYVLAIVSESAPTAGGLVASEAWKRASGDVWIAPGNILLMAEETAERYEEERERLGEPDNVFADWWREELGREVAPQSHRRAEGSHGWHSVYWWGPEATDPESGLVAHVSGPEGKLELEGFERWERYDEGGATGWEVLKVDGDDVAYLLTPWMHSVLASERKRRMRSDVIPPEPVDQSLAIVEPVTSDPVELARWWVPLFEAAVEGSQLVSGWVESRGDGNLLEHWGLHGLADATEGGER